MVLVSSVTALGGDAISNFRLMEEGRQLSVDAVRALISAVDQKDEYTSCHSTRVGIYPVMFGKAVGLDAGGWQVDDRDGGGGPREVCRGATGTGAERWGMGDELGAIRETMLADLIVVDGDRTVDIAVLQEPARVAAIMKGGRFVKDDLGGPEG